jgi:mono/diheme cytochrome c family protein
MTQRFGRLSIVQAAGAWLLALSSGGSWSQNAGSAPADAAKPPVAVSDFPRPPEAPAAIERGKQVFSVNCGFCHGSGARGGEGGPNLLRSPIVLNDQHGELIGAIVSNGRIDKGMPKFNLPIDSIADIAAYLHSIDVGASSASFDPKKVLVGNAAAGKAFFNGPGQCKECHSVHRDLAGIGSKYDAPHLQDMIFTGGGTGIFGEPTPTAPPITVKLVMPSGETIAGHLVELDDFDVTLIDVAGDRRTIRRDGDTPKVEIDNPLGAHRDWVRRWEDKDLHNVTAYLATLK